MLGEPATVFERSGKRTMLGSYWRYTMWSAPLPRGRILRRRLIQRGKKAR